MPKCFSGRVCEGQIKEHHPLTEKQGNIRLTLALSSGSPAMKSCMGDGQRMNPGLSLS